MNSSTNAISIQAILYKNNIYYAIFNEIDLQSAKKLMGKKIGTVSGDGGKSTDSVGGLEANFKVEVYAMKGYDRNYILLGISYGRTVILQRMSGMTVSSGKDILGKLNMGGTARSIAYLETGKPDETLRVIDDQKLINDFTRAMNRAMPVSIYKVPHMDEEEYGRIIKIRMKDGTVDLLNLIQGGYIVYGNGNSFAFKMDDRVFDRLWKLLKP